MPAGIATPKDGFANVMEKCIYILFICMINLMAVFHFWSPDVLDGIPTVVTTFVAIIPKISIFIFLLELVHYTSQSMFEFNWTSLLLLSSLA